MRLNSLIIMACSIILISCTPQIDVRGHIPQENLITKIQPGHQNREQVIELLGSPSAMATFQDNRWYYITQQTESSAFFDPKLVDQSIIVIEFDEGGFVNTINKLSKEDAKEIAFVSRITPTKGKRLGFFEQIIGNLGIPVVGE